MQKQLYRKVNTRTRWCSQFHDLGGDYKNTRNSKGDNRRESMSGKNHGRDYSPLFKFLLSKIGEDFDKVYSDAKSRLDNEKPIFWMIKRYEHEDNYPCFHVGESTYYSKLYVDDDNCLQKIDPKFNHTTLAPSCPCCTHTFNGVVFSKKYKENKNSV